MSATAPSGSIPATARTGCPISARSPPGGTPEAADLVDALYAGIITAGTFRAAGIRIAEAAKVIENTQRDLNIALVNELAMIFNRMGLDTQAVLEAAGTKWNFLPFRPGLVGGHCIGVDPYYLTHKAEEIGYRPEIILAGRRINDGMGAYVAGQMIKAMLRRRLPVDGARVLVMGLAFKENCPDLRNTRVVDVIAELRDYGVAVDVHDPLVIPAGARRIRARARRGARQARAMTGSSCAWRMTRFAISGLRGSAASGGPAMCSTTSSTCWPGRGRPAALNASARRVAPRAAAPPASRRSPAP